MYSTFLAIYIMIRIRGHIGQDEEIQPMKEPKAENKVKPEEDPASLRASFKHSSTSKGKKLKEEKLEIVEEPVPDPTPVEQLKLEGPSCNSFLATRYVQGLILNLSTFTHVCFAAVLLRALLAGHYETEDGSKAPVIVSALLLALSAISIVAGNRTRFNFWCEHLSAEPKVHRLLPNNERNMKMCWLMYQPESAIMMQACSLSDYFYELDGPTDLYASACEGEDGHDHDHSNTREVDPESDTPALERIIPLVTGEKFAYEEAPHAILIAAQLILFLVVLPDEDPIPSLAYLGITILSMIVCKLLENAEHESKSVDLHVMGLSVKNRLQAIKERAGEGLPAPVVPAEPKESEEKEGKKKAALNVKDLAGSARWAAVADGAGRGKEKEKVKPEPKVEKICVSSESGDEGVWHSDTEEGT